jgi:hypothetical protein
MENKIRIKFVSKNGIKPFHFLQLKTRYPNLEFCLDVEDQSYDWFVVYDDLPATNGERFSAARELLACPAENTILLTYEPSSIKVYGDDYTRQFRYILTSHDADRLKHPGRLDYPPVGYWYYGDDTDLLGPDGSQNKPVTKSKDLSIFLSKKADGHTYHKLRFDFSMAVADHFGDRIDKFGWAYNFVEKKAEGLDPYKYTLALENHIGPHHWTEKLSDAFLGYALPFYAGCPNVSDYFPEDSFVAIDMMDISGSIEIIERAIRDNIHEKHLPAIIEARRRVIEDYNLPNFIGETIEQAEAVGASAAGNANRTASKAQNYILSRRRMRGSSIGHALRYNVQKIKNRYYYYKQNAKIRDGKF